jgi:hypothetical protein
MIFSWALILIIIVFCWFRNLLLLVDFFFRITLNWNFFVLIYLNWLFRWLIRIRFFNIFLFFAIRLHWQSIIFIFDTLFIFVRSRRLLNALRWLWLTWFLLFIWINLLFIIFKLNKFFIVLKILNLNLLNFFWWFIF